MYSIVELGWRYLQYYCKASNGKGHGVHSPFVFDFIKNVLNDNRHFYAYAVVEQLRKDLLSDNRILQVQDMGAGSRNNPSSEWVVKDLAKAALKPAKFGQLLFRIASYYSPRSILELGTSFGISTAYLALADPSAKLTTIEGDPAVAGMARQHFDKLGLDTVNLLRGNFDTLLPSVTEAGGLLDLVFIDGNHRYEPTMRYYRQLLPVLHEYSVLIFDDIHWSREMEQAWSEIKQQPEVALTIDLFFIGLVFFRKENKVKQDFIIRF